MGRLRRGSSRGGSEGHGGARRRSVDITLWHMCIDMCFGSEIPACWEQHTSSCQWGALACCEQATWLLPCCCVTQARIKYDPASGLGPRGLIAAVEGAGFEAKLWKGAISGEWHPPIRRHGTGGSSGLFQGSDVEVLVRCVLACAENSWIWEGGKAGVGG